MAYYEDLRKHFKKEDIITIIKVKELFKVTYPTAKALVLENELKGILQRDEIGSEDSTIKKYIWRLK